MRKTLAVLLPNYNYGRYLRKTLNAIVSQSRPADEIIVVDDCSTDNSLEILAEFKDHANFRVIKNDRNRGAVYSLNRALEETQADFVFCTASDDMILPGFFEESLAALERWPQAALCAAHPAYLIDGTEKIDLNLSRPYFREHTCFLSPSDLKGNLGPDGLWIAGHASIYDRKKFIEAGRHLEQLKWHCDWFGLHILALRSGICYIPKPLSSIRIGHQSYSSQAQADPKAQANVLWEMARILNSEPYSDVKNQFIEAGLLDHYPDYKNKMLIVLKPWGDSVRDYLPMRSFFEGLSSALASEISALKVFIRSQQNRSSFAQLVVRSGQAIKSVARNLFHRRATKNV